MVVNLVPAGSIITGGQMSHRYPISASRVAALPVMI